MNTNPLNRFLRPALIALGGVLMLVGALLVASGFAARNAAQKAEQVAVSQAALLASELRSIQRALEAEAVQTVALRLLSEGRRSEVSLLEAVHAAGVDQPRSAQVFDAVLEDVELGEYPEPDVRVLEMLLEARRTGAAVPEVNDPTGQSPHLVFAQRLDDEGSVRGILLLRMPVDALVSYVDWSDELDYLALTQGQRQSRIEIWQRGQRPAREPSRQAVADSRFWLEWHRSTTLPSAGLRAASVVFLVGLALLLISFRGHSLAPLWSDAGAKLSGLNRFRERWAAKKTATRTAGTDHPVSGSFRSNESSTPDGLDWDAADSLEAGSGPVEPDSPVRPAVDQRPSVSTPEYEDEDEDLAPPLPFPEEPVADPEPAAEDERAPEREREPDAELSLSEDHAAPGPAAEPPAPDRAGTPPDVQPPPADRKPGEGHSESARLSERPSPVDARLFTDAGILGRFEAGLDARAATLIGGALGDLASERGVERVAVGRDARLHGPVLMAGLINGLRSAGIHVVDIGAGPTPVLDYAVRELPGMTGVMVTGSHLPADWNGFRITLNGNLLTQRDILALQERIIVGSGAGGAGEMSEQAFSRRYVEAVSARVQLERPLKVVVDCANGASGLIVPRLLAAVGADAIPLYADVDGSFPSHLPDPSRLENLEDVRLCVRNFRADLGFALGGDGDRLVMLGPHGEVYWPDRLLTVLVRDLLDRTPGATVVQDAMCSPRLGRFVESLGGRSVVTDLGPAAVQAALLELDGALGVTFAGQVFEGGDWATGGDALYAICRLLEILAADTRDVPDLLAEIPDWFSQPPLFLPTRPSTPEKVLDRLMESADVSGAEVGNEHGFSIDHGDAWTRICRSADGSGLMVRFEGDDEAAVARLTELVRHLLLQVDERLKLPF